MAKSQNGWCALHSNESRLLYTWTVPGDGTRLRLRQGFAGFLLIHLATRFDRKVEDLKEPILDDWGYAFRPIRGFVVMSNHSSGTAMDLNATDHPMGVRDTFDEADQARIHRLLRKYDGAIRWGGTFRTRADDMHFEIDKPRLEIIDLAKSLARTKRGEEVLRANPEQRKILMG